MLCRARIQGTFLSIELASIAYQQLGNFKVAALIFPQRTKKAERIQGGGMAGERGAAALNRGRRFDDRRQLFCKGM